jgi:hypothetical protein
MDYIHEIWKSYSPGELFWDVIAGLIPPLIVTLFSKTPRTEGSTPRMKIESIGESIGCIVAIFSFFTFVFIYVFKQNEILKNTNISHFLTLKAITDSFLISYGTFLLFHSIHSIRQVFNGKLSSSKFLEGLTLLVLYPALFTLVILYVKMAVESASGMSLEQLDAANDMFRVYWEPLFKIVVVCFSILIFGTILKIVKSLITKQ